MSMPKIDPAQAGRNTRIEVMYRDADNYKEFKSFVLAGRLDVAQAEHIGRTLNDGEFFLPTQVGLPALMGEFSHGAGWDEQSDHPWHTIAGVEFTDDRPSDGVPSISELMAKWPKSPDDWDGEAAEEKLKKELPAVTPSP